MEDFFDRTTLTYGRDPWASAADLAVGFLPWLDTGSGQQTLYAQDWIFLANAHHSNKKRLQPLMDMRK
jgi:hypothetical protein